MIDQSISGLRFIFPSVAVRHAVAHLCADFHVKWGVTMRESLMVAYALREAVVALCSFNLCYLRRKVMVVGGRVKNSSVTRTTYSLT